MKPLCDKCSVISSYLDGRNLVIHKDMWEDLHHEKLLTYHDFNNGVSESGTSYICEDCWFCVETDFHISMDTDEIIVYAVTTWQEQDLYAMATAFVLKDELRDLKIQLAKQESIPVYMFASLLSLYIYGSGTSNERRIYALDSIKRYGLHHKDFHIYFDFHPSLNELFLNAPRRDSYCKSKFILFFNLPTTVIESHVFQSTIRMTTKKEIPPENIQLYDLEAGVWIPISKVTKKACTNRDDDTFLKLLRECQYEELQRNGKETQRQVLIAQKLTVLAQLKARL